jgi:hypothetical protein
MTTIIMCNIFSTNHEHSLIFKVKFSNNIRTNKGWETHPLLDLSTRLNNSLQNREFFIVFFPKGSYQNYLLPPNENQVKVARFLFGTFSSVRTSRFSFIDKIGFFTIWQLHVNFPFFFPIILCYPYLIQSFWIPRSFRNIFVYN